MKVSMSNDYEGVQVTVTVQALSPNEQPSRPALQLGSEGSYDADAATCQLQEILNQALPGVLREADAQIRVAIAEKLLSQLMQSRPDSSVRSVRATEIIVVHGPEGCGKTISALYLADYFKADELMDGVIYPERIAPGLRTLIISNSSISEVLSELPPGIVNNCSVQFIHFNAVPKEQD